MMADKMNRLKSGAKRLRRFVSAIRGIVNFVEAF
jgi:hypothetical protein